MVGLMSIQCRELNYTFLAQMQDERMQESKIQSAYVC